MTIDAPETVIVNTTRVACDGIGGGLGHPKVYLEMGNQDFVECPYCDRRFVLASSSDVSAEASAKTAVGQVKAAAERESH
jgi:uncharacterized Zn-finger protein